MATIQKNRPTISKITGQIRRKWWELLLLAALAAIGAAVWPSAYCAIADCSAEDKWCNGDCSQSCGPVTGVGFVSSCYIQAGQCRERWFPDRVQLNCDRDGNCLFDSSSNFSFKIAGEGRWNVGACGKFPNCNPIIPNVDVVTCCGGSGSSGGGEPSCTLSFDPPVLNLSSAGYSPSRPLVIGQDPDRLGVDITGISAQGGLRHCPDDGSRALVTSFSVQVNLSPASQAWIQGDLRRKYPGAQILGSYPILPEPRASGLQSSLASLTFHFDPLDPGLYEVSITVTQEDGKTVSGTLQVPAWLLEAAITK